MSVLNRLRPRDHRRLRRSSTARRSRPLVEVMEDRLAPAGLVNGDFSISDPANPGYGWTTKGNATITGGVGNLAEGTQAESEFSQTFTITPGTTTLNFTIVASNLVTNGAASPPDAFEAALLNTQTLLPLVGPPGNLSNTDAFLNIQQTGQVSYATGVTVPGAGASGTVATLTTPLVVSVNLSNVPANTQATLFFDLIGFSPASSSVQIDNVQTVQPPSLSFGLAPGSDSGAVGDNLTNDNPVTLVGTTDPGATVSLDTTGGGFNNGTTTADASGNFTFSNVTLAEGSNLVRVQSSDPNGSTIATQTIKVDTQAPTGVLVNPAPNSTVGVDPGFIDVQWTDHGDAGLDTSTFGASDVTIQGVTVSQAENLGNGLVRYHYLPGPSGLASGTVNVVIVGGQVADLAGNSNTQSTASFVFQPQAAQGPVAVNDTYNTHFGTALVVNAAQGVLANDTDSNPGAVLTAIKVADPAHGTVTLASNGSFIYTPTAGYVGPDHFTYEANDGTTSSNVATVSINVTDTAPVAVNDSYSVHAGKSLVVSAAQGLLANDTDADGDPLTAVKMTDPAHGTVTVGANGSFTYTPTAGYTGPDSFTYEANDGALNSAAATVSINVTDTAPVAANDSYHVHESGSLIVAAAGGVLANDTDADGDALTAVKLTDPTHGTVALASDGSFIYTPTAGYSGPDSFTYEANDGALNSNAATVSINVSNAVPVAVNDRFTAQENTKLVVDPPGVLANDTDADGDPLNAIKLTDPSHGTVSLRESGGFSYTPNTGYTGPDSFTYQASDGTRTSNAATVSITVQPPSTPPPVAQNDQYSTKEGARLNIAAPGVLTNDTSGSGAALSAALAKGPSNGRVTLNANGSFTYIPNPGFSGDDGFTYEANDGTQISNVADVRIDVTPVAATPTANPDSYSTFQNRSLAIAAPGVLANDDAPSGAATAVLVTSAAHGTLSLHADGSFTYIPDDNYRGADSFTYRDVAAGVSGNTATVTLTITPAGLQLLPNTPFYNYLRARRSLDPSRFDSWHPRIGAILGLELTGMPNAPTQLIGSNNRFNIAPYSALFTRNPAALGARQPILSVLFQLENVQAAPAPSQLLPPTARLNAFRAQYEQNPIGFDRAHPYYGASFAIEQIEQGVVPSIQLALASSSAQAAKTSAVHPNAHLQATLNQKAIPHHQAAKPKAHTPG